MSYTVLARRYRSQTFDDVVGQDAIAQTLKNAIKSDRVAHAYLFCGTRGVGKTTMARILAKSLNCLNADGPTTEPCLKCDSCLAVNSGDDIDVIEIDGASNRGIDNIRELRQNAIYRPARARFKIYIVDEVHMLTTEAFNALLKILEEPPAHVKFIFATTEPNKVLPTIQSRCQRFDFAFIGPETIAKQLGVILKDEGIRFEDDFLYQLSRLANGSMRDALSLLDQLISGGSQPLTLAMLEQLLGRPGAEHLLALTQAIFASDPTLVLKGIEILVNQGQNASQIAESLVEIFRDMMVLKTAGTDSNVLLLSGINQAKLAQAGGAADVPWLIFGITAMERLRWTLRNSETARALLEASLLRLALSEHFIGLDALSQQLRGGSPAVSADVKKKPLTATIPNSQIAAHSVQTPPIAAKSMNSPSAEPIPFTGTVDCDSIRSNWSKLIEQLQSQNAQIGSLLSPARPGDFRNGCLIIQLNDNGSGKFAVEMCSKKNDLVEKVFSGVLLRPVTIKYELIKFTEDKTKAAPQEQAAPGARINRQQQEEVLSDPAVRIVLQGLSARPIQIERVEEPDSEKSDTPEEEA